MSFDDADGFNAWADDEVAAADRDVAPLPLVAFNQIVLSLIDDALPAEQPPASENDRESSVRRAA